MCATGQTAENFQRNLQPFAACNVSTVLMLSGILKRRSLGEKKHIGGT